MVDVRVEFRRSCCCWVAERLPGGGELGTATNAGRVAKASLMV